MFNFNKSLTISILCILIDFSDRGSLCFTRISKRSLVPKTFKNPNSDVWLWGLWIILGRCGKEKSVLLLPVFVPLPGC